MEDIARFSVIVGRYNPQNYGTIWIKDKPKELAKALFRMGFSVGRFRKNSRGFRVVNSSCKALICLVPCQ